MGFPVKLDSGTGADVIPGDRLGERRADAHPRPTMPQPARRVQSTRCTPNDFSLGSITITARRAWPEANIVENAVQEPGPAGGCC